MRPAIFLDRDGVIIENRNDYVKSWGEVRFLPTAFEALRRLARSAYAVVLVTNQSVVGRGIITLEQAVEINECILDEIRNQGGRIDAGYLCPHHPQDGCSCRKPEPGMLVHAAAQLDLDLAHSFMVGDAASDIQAAHAVGARGILVLSGRGVHQAPLLTARGLQDCPVMADLAAAAEYILAQERTGT